MSGRPAARPAAAGPILEVDGLTVGFRTEAGRVAVVEDVSFSVAAGRTLGLVGESGCGKSVTAMTIMRLLPSPPAFLSAGRIVLEGRDLARLDEAAMRPIRGDAMAMIFQEPMTSLNPAWTVGFQVAEALRLHRPVSRAEARERTLGLMRQVGIGAPERRLAQYPHELSGGLRQRMMIAMAIACGPRLLIADEPTTALDVTIQAQILDLLTRLQRELGMAILLITHDLGVVAEHAHEVAVMYAGRIVERAAVRSLFARPRHPYTHGLLAATPRLAAGRRRLAAIPGMVPRPGRRPAGCTFAERCGRVQDRCRAEVPPLAPGTHGFACWNPVP